MEIIRFEDNGKIIEWHKMKMPEAIEEANKLIKIGKLPKFRIDGNIIYMKKITKTHMKKLRLKWKKYLLERINEVTEEDLYDSACTQFYLDYQIAWDNPYEIVRMWFYRETMNDIMDMKVIWE